MKIVCIFIVLILFASSLTVYAGCPGKCENLNDIQSISPFDVSSQIVNTSETSKKIFKKHPIPNPKILPAPLETSFPPKKIALSDPQVVKISELPQIVILSNRDLNRIVCAAGEFEGQGLVTSREKGIDVEILKDHKNAFVKLPVTKIDTPDGSSIKYFTEPFELYALCGGNVYTLIVKPKNTSAQTVILQGSSEKEELKKNLDIFRGQREAEQICSLVKMAFLDDIPASFKQKMLPQKPMNLFSNLDVVPYREILVKGIGLRLREYFLYPKVSNLHLNPSDFARKEFFKGLPRGVFLSALTPTASEPVRLFIVESVVKPFEPKFFPFGGLREH